MFEKKVLNIYSIIIGIFFLISGIGKVIDTTGFSILIYQYGFKYFTILSPLIVLIEILIGLVLILLINPKRCAAISFVMLVIFTSAFAYAHFENGINDCGCLGSVEHTSLPPAFSFIRNFILLSISLIVWVKYPKITKYEVAKWKKYLLAFLMSVAIFTTGFTFKIPADFKIKKELNNKYQNKNIRNTILAEYVNLPQDKTYLIFCFSYTCPHCLNSIENLRQYKRSNTVDSLITFATGKEKDKIAFFQTFNPDFYVKDLSHETMQKIVDFFPTTFYIKHDTVKVVVQGELPSYVIFNKQYESINNN